ncbi:hypothetical protein PORY_000894 [Pneumocystis oryctolagi]|uniref:Uncharacterized protein n=1 Tax=Pneumocystis oryctolagi TaxID=42067 RepID=A0ACB7CG95_9ASCO|nr:hypothetical protein PORY_000894 [Pneumocystis oryctolagi]
MKTVIFLKKKTNSSDNYERIFKDYGFYTVFIPVLTCTFVNQERLKSLLKNNPCTMFSAFIFTSKNSVYAFKEGCIHMNKQELEQIFNNITVYTVGPATFKEVKRLGFHKVFGKETGCAKILADFIISDHIDKRPILFLSGYRRMNDLEKKLSSSGIVLEELVVYKTEESEEFGHLFNEIINDQTLNINWIIFFSPYASNIVMKYIQMSAILQFKIATIGFTTLTYLNDKWNIKVNVTAQYPDANSLLKAIMNYEKDNCQD